MRVLLSTIGSRGDVQPLVALALELKTLGHDARLCVPPDFCEWIGGLGLAVTPIGPELRQASAVFTASTPPTAEQIRQMTDASVAGQFDTITAAAQGCDAIVAATALQIAARSVAEKLGIRYVFAAYTPTVLPSPHHAPPPMPARAGMPPPSSTNNRELWAWNAQRFNATFGDALNFHRAAAGLAPIDDVRSYMFTDRPWLACDQTLGPWPDPNDGHVFQPGAWILPDERPLPADLETFLGTGDAPIYFGFGSMRPPQDVNPVLMRLEAARAVGRRAIVSRGWADLSAVEAEPDCFVLEEANLRALFARVAVVVHHGGAGTTTLGALGGAPQVLIPQVYDQHYWAGRIEALGLGRAVPPDMLTADSLTRALEWCLQSDVMGRARSLAPAVRQDGVRVAAQRLIQGD